MSESNPSSNNSVSLEFPEELKKRARTFFEKAASVAYTMQYDFAIEMYLDGLSFWPEAVEEGHKKLWEVALRRQASGGKKSGMGDRSKYRKMAAKSEKDSLLKAEYLWAKDPVNASHLTDMIKAAHKGQMKQTTAWVADILFETNMKAAKPAFDTYILLRDTYAELENYTRAVQALQLALQLKPKDRDLEESLRNLSAKETLQKGKYEEDGDFRQSIKDREDQERLHEGEQLIKSDEYHREEIEQARKLYKHDPEGKGNIEKLVKSLCNTEKPEFENEAISVLEGAYRRTNQFIHRQRANDIRIRQLRRELRLLQDIHKSNPNDQSTIQQYNAKLGEFSKLEMDHFRQCVENYPTDRKMKFEYGKRLLRARKYDDAIPMFQESRSDPRFRTIALNSIGMCFFYKEWYPDAIESFQQAFDNLDDKEGSMAKELLYNLGRAYEADNNDEEALKCYRQVTQIDFNYSDAKNRVDELRKKQRENS